MLSLKKLVVVVLVAVGGCSYGLRVHPSPVPEPVRKQISANGLTVSYEYLGDSATSAPVLVLLHGFGGSLESWSDVLPLIVPRHAVLRMDLKGFGLTDKPRDREYAAVDQAKIVVGVIRALGIQRPVLVGHSFGGSVAFATYLQLRSE